MAIPTETDVLTAARFSLSVDGHELASFSELGGITSSIEVADVVETAGNDTVLKHSIKAATFWSRAHFRRALCCRRS